MAVVVTGRAVAEGLAGLLRLPLNTTEPELLRRAIDLAGLLTDSPIGYLHYVNDDQETIELGTWSSGTFDYCTTTSDRHYPLTRAGIWAETFRTRSAQVVNDYQHATGRRGLPKGHPPLVRHLGVPCLDGGAVRLLLGVGNKPAPYDDQDVRVVQQVVDDTWLIMQRLRDRAWCDQTLALVMGGPSTAHIGTWEWDPDGQVVTWGAVAQRLLGLDSSTSSTWQPLLSTLTPQSAQDLLERIAEGDGATGIDLSLTLAGGVGGPRTVRLSGTWVPRPTCAGSVLRGVVSDTSLATRLEVAHFAALHDPLTGLLNRPGLAAAIDRRADTPGLRPGDPYAVHFLDLDGFKAVNDRHGHFVGDEVLRLCAERLRHSVGASDVVARFGGDEFVIVQPGAGTARDVRGLGDGVIRALSAPITLGTLVVEVGASIGAVVSGVDGPDLEVLFERADAALYQAKARGGGLVVLANPPDGGRHPTDGR